jgi:hypothetical protein
MKNRKVRKRRLALIGVALTVLLLVAVTWTVLRSEQQNADQTSSSDAALVDQLSSSYPNSTFYFSANSMFHNNGWLLHYYAGIQISDNVDFYRSLPSYAFKIIILRAHTALAPDTKELAIFTSEEWSDAKAVTTYLLDIMDGKLARVRVTTNSTAYFGITPNFIKALNGNFQNAIIVMMGCDGLANAKMAEAFIEKGAKAYIGWNGLVSTDHTDFATQQLLMHLIAEKETIGTAITETMSEVGNDPAYGSVLSYYPMQAGDYRA